MTNQRGSAPLTPPAQTIPAIPILAACFLLAGLGTVVLGPILPDVSTHWHLHDNESGRLLLAKFTAACLGGIALQRNLRRSLILGTILAALGFASFAFATGQLTGVLTIAIAGFGLGQIIASTNLLAGLHFREHTGSGLAIINFFFSLGAVITGILTARLVPAIGLRSMLLALAALFALCMTGVVLSSHSSAAPSSPQQSPQITTRTLILFGALIFLYGGLETSLSSWLTTYSQRYSAGVTLGGATALVLFWAALTAGRLLASALLRFLGELTTATIGVAGVAILTAALAIAHGKVHALDWACVGLGLALAPWFPSVFALLVHRGPTPRQAGTILAVSGLGAALFPWLMGVISTHFGSLRIAMLVPAALAVALFASGFLRDLRARN